MLLFSQFVENYTQNKNQKFKPLINYAQTKNQQFKPRINHS